MQRIRNLLREFRSADQLARPKISKQISDAFINKLNRISRNWPDTKLDDLQKIAHALNPDYLDQILRTPEVILLCKSDIAIAHQRYGGSNSRLFSYENRICGKGILVNEKLLVENPCVIELQNQKKKPKARRLQVWSDWHEDPKQIRKHLGKPTRNASTWSLEISSSERQLIEKAAIEKGHARFLSLSRIDFVYEHSTEVGNLYKSKNSSKFIRVELAKQPLKHNRHVCSFHGFPITEEQYISF